MRWVIGARKSDLARTQAYFVGSELQKLSPGAQIDYHFKTSLGDRNLKDPLWKAPEKGLFTEDFAADLRDGTCDLVVHSWKDLPTAERLDTLLFSPAQREDIRDMLLFKPGSVGKKQITLLSSSPRRAHNLTSFCREHLPSGVDKVQWEDVRGNVPTRIRKLQESEADGLIVAKAALDRLLTSPQEEFDEVKQFLRQVLSELKVMVLPLRLNPTAAAQGALAIEVLKTRKDLIEKLQALGGQKVAETVEAERARLKGFGGGCHLKLGITRLVRPYGELEIVLGETPEGEPLTELSFAPHRWPPEPEDPSKVWPQNSKERGEAQRVALEPPGEQSYLDQGFDGLYVSRAEALPPSWQAEKFDWVWTAGLTTWRKLAQRGVWVHGSSEGLGEAEDMRLQELNGGDIKWLKVTHSEAGTPKTGRTTLSTYEVQRNILPESLKGRTHFYWNSGTEFLAAVQLDPAVRDGYHFCGPGRTSDIVAEALGGAERIYTFIEGYRFVEPTREITK